MARIHSALRNPAAGRINRRERELNCLFGRELVKTAIQTDPADLKLTEQLMDAVHDAADNLLYLSDQPDKQRAYVQRLSYTVRLVLCMWVHDMGLAAKLTAEAIRGQGESSVVPLQARGHKNILTSAELPNGGMNGKV